MFDAADAIRRFILDAASLTRLDALARPLLGGVGAVLMLHRVSATPTRPGSPNRHLTVTPAFLDAALAAIAADGFDFVSLDEALARLHAGGGRFAAVTADDGYRDNAAEALPVLERHRAPLTVFIAPALTDRAVPLWWEAIEDIAFSGRTVALPGGRGSLACHGPPAFRRLLRLMSREVAETAQAGILKSLAEQAGTDPFRPGRGSLMDWEELRALARHPLVTIGAHTLHHYALARLPLDLARREIAEGRDRLAAELGEMPRHLAFPYGYASAAGRREVRLAAEAGFASAVTTRHGLLHRGHAGHLHALPRISLNGRFQDPAQTRVMVRGLTVPLANRGRLLVTV